MKWWRDCADQLYAITRLLKEQEKQTPNKICKLKKAIAEFLRIWVPRITENNPIFWKLHTLMCCMIRFVEKTGMTGRANAEGFENTHYKISKLKAMMSGIPQTQLRCEKLSQRQQICLIPEIE